ncbi:MFS transporter [Saccharopolyspora phatthalungensis]|uniref:Putative proline/betaine transporter n=1 Tax=Saccharopolyspora phatthalungensis TaxID=664693 RepID=A0A840Q188_9PSEU|nr:MFS transporter [Saccharopolyspora phatthalungensis]MBB5152509.1 metabolite-proton symporter [Saccharopolyspora phatthalungensis]
METASTVDQTTRTQRRRAVVASVVGTTIEWYDFFLYGTTAALIFPRVFFPHSDQNTAILESFATLFVGFAARPVGAAVFGHFGDRIGRKATLISTLVLMGVATMLIGAVPGYATIGLAAPVLLVVLRVLQGIGVGGEWGGSVLLAMEWGAKKRRGLMASWPQMGVPIGLVLSTGAVQLFSATTGGAFETWGWRIPFLASFVLILIGLYVRLRVLESPDFREVKQARAVVKMPVWRALRDHPLEVFTAAFVRLSEQAPFYLFVTFVLTYGTVELQMPRGQILNYTLIAAAIGLISIPFFGHLSDWLGRKWVYGAGIVLTALFAFPYFALLDTRIPALVLLGIVVSLIVHDIQYGPQAALIAEAFGTNVRYSGAGLGYQLASVIAGGPAPLIAAALLTSTGSSTSISWYIVGCCVLAFGALLLMPGPAIGRVASSGPLGPSA